MYNPKSHKAEEFISNEEILATLDYAKENKSNIKTFNKYKDKVEFVWLTKSTSEKKKSTDLKI